MILTAEVVSRSTGSAPSTAHHYLPHLQAACDKFGIDTPKRVAGFLSQIGHESSGMSKLEESLNYSVEALLKMFGRRRISEADARRFGRTATQRANQESIANCIYGGKWGRENLGNTQPGDGWRFRGRGLKQLTGQDNYLRCGQAIGVDLIANPDKLVEPVNAAMSAGWFWQTNNLNALADRGDVAAMTKKINGGSIGLEQRQALYTGAVTALA